MPEFDSIGPEKILEVYNPKIGMHGFVVIDNTALGPGKGGIRMTPSVSKHEVFRLARAMTWKCSLAEIPFGGAKSGIVANPANISVEKKHEIIKTFSKAIKAVCPDYYIAAPDINTGSAEMKSFAEANGNNKSCTGKPVSMGGIPHEFGSTGFGVFIALKIAAEYKGIDLNKAKIAIEGFGNVGGFVGKYLTEETGAKLIGVSDIGGLRYDKNGLDYNKLIKARDEKGSVTEAKQGEKLPHKAIVGLDVDILVTAAMPDLITSSDINSIKAKLIVEGSNIPVTHELEELLERKGIVVIPDFVANAGGVISSYVEYIEGTKKQAFKMIEEKISKNLKKSLELKEEFESIRGAAMHIAKNRILEKCSSCLI